MDASLEALLSHRAWVRALASALAQPADADDLEQEAWLAALERPPEGIAPKAWLATVLRRAAAKMRRTVFRRAVRERAAARPEATGAAADLVARAETHERLVHAVLGLPEPFRSTILHRFFEGLSPSEIARRTATPIDTVKARLRRGLDRIRADLPQGRAWTLAILGVALPRRLLAFGTLAMTLKTKLAIVATALLVAGSAVTYRAIDRAGAPPRALSTPGALASRDIDAGVSETVAPAAPPRPDQLARDFLVRGCVRGARGFLAYAVGDVDGKRRLVPLLEYSISADGRYVTRFPFQGAGASWEIDFGVFGDGFVRQAVRLAVEPGGHYEADFAVEPGVAISGAVADTDGRPVTDLAVVAVASAMPPWGLATAEILETDSLLVAHPMKHFARFRTDALGRFEIAGLAPGTYALFSCTEDWILEHGPLEAPAGDARVVAVPAHALVGTIRDAWTGATAPEALVIVHVRTTRGSGSDKWTTVRDGRLWVVWKPQDPEIEEGFEATVEVRAAGYARAERVVAFPRGTRRAVADFLLDPVEAEKLALLRFEVTDTRGRLVETELCCAVAAVDATERQPIEREFRAVGPGLFELRAPSGPWSITILPRWAMGAPLAWSGTVELGRDERVRCTLPPFGIVRLRRAAVGSWLACAETADGNRSYLWQVDTRELLLAAAPGEWRVGGGAGAARNLREGLRAIVVFDGTETVVELD